MGCQQYSQSTLPTVKTGIFCTRAWVGQRPVRTTWKFSSTQGLDPWTVQSVVGRYTGRHVHVVNLSFMCQITVKRSKADLYFQPSVVSPATPSLLEPNTISKPSLKMNWLLTLYFLDPSVSWAVTYGSSEIGQFIQKWCCARRFNNCQQGDWTISKCWWDKVLGHFSRSVRVRHFVS